MNILPKKSFHVLNKDNVTKVKRDEKEANRKAKESQERFMKAEQEWRLDRLRNDAKNSTKASNSGFIFETAKSNVTNKEREVELEREKTKSEMKMGVLTYLGGSEWNPVSKRSPAPWYTRNRSDVKVDDKGGDEERKNLEDPLAVMNSILKEPGIKPRENFQRKDRKHEYKRDERAFDSRRRERIDRDSIDKKKRKKKSIK